MTKVRHSRGTGAPAEVFRASLRLGLTSFGGPIAHLGYFERTYVEKLRWLTAADYAGMVALCQLLPGPSSSQVGLLIGYHRAGWRGALAAWTGFTLPSALLMYGFALYALRAEGLRMQSIVHGLMLAAVAVVAQAVWSMTRSLCPDWRRRGIAAFAMILLLFRGGAVVQLAAMLIGAVGGWLLCRGLQTSGYASPAGLNLRTARLLLAIVGVLFVVLTVLAALFPHGAIAFTSLFYRAGTLVFGGGHVMLPILRAALVPSGWLSDRSFLIGYGFAQALPGPLFAFAAYLGAVCAPASASWIWATLALLAIFLPGLLLAMVGMGLWGRLGGSPPAQAAVAGINAAVVGILGAALYHPVSTTALHSGVDVGVAVTGLVLLQGLHVPPILVVALCVIASAITAAVS